MGLFAIRDIARPFLGDLARGLRRADNYFRGQRRVAHYALGRGKMEMPRPIADLRQRFTTDEIRQRRPWL